MARSLWPAGIHVAIVVLDGVVDFPKTREVMRDKSDDFFIKPKDVAESAFWLSVKRVQPGRSPLKRGLSGRRGESVMNMSRGSRAKT